MTEKEWRRKMLRMGLALVPVGFLLMGLGAYYASGPQGMTGYVIGSGGLVLLVLGALFTKFSAFGPVPDKYRGRMQ